ncbi:MAG TPA: galactose-1-phosphate uridylyltransferase [Gaiellaceae bacterium]|nr:galactose-1-phosphate uridylyltransferase [Gaiellaceae bacterium]
MRERRLDPVTGLWTTFTNVPPDRAAAEDSSCPLCPAQLGIASYEVVVLEDPHPPLEPSPPPTSTDSTDFYAVAAARGAAEIVAHGDQHDATLKTLGVDALERAIHVWADRYADLGGREEIGYTLVHATVGEEAGATLAHPHSRVDGYPEIPPRPLRELEWARRHLERTGRCVHCDVVRNERRGGTRIVHQDASFLAFVPFAARAPYEVHVISQRHAASLLDLTNLERRALSEILHRVLSAYDELFGRPLPYVLGIHQAPTDDGQWLDVSHLHVELVPPNRGPSELRRSYAPELEAGVLVNSGVPERSAEELRTALAAA